MKMLFASLALVFSLLPLAAQPHAVESAKIDSLLLQQAQAGGEVEFLILFQEQAELKDAHFLPKKADKGAFVYQKLSETARRTQARTLELLHSFQAPAKSFFIVNAVWSKGTLPILLSLAQLPEVAGIQQNPPVRLQQPEQVRNDNQRTITWGIDYINANDVWNLGYTGAGVVIGGQDTGYDWQHNALKLKYRGWNSANNTATHDYNWHDAIHENNPNNSGTNPCGYNLTYPCDDGYHGTHTMGTMTGDDGGANQIGVAPGAKWIGCRNMERGWGTPSTYLECFQWFLAPTDLNGSNANTALAPDVINNSWGCPPVEGCNSGNFAIMETAIQNLRNAGVVVVASAGNSGPSCSTVSDPPAIFPGSLSVGATNSSGSIASFSSRGPALYNSTSFLKPNISAPGVSVYSCITGGSYGTLNGTSMAGPHVAGAVALVLSANPNLSGQVETIENILESTAAGKTTNDGCGGNTSSSIPNNTFGYGILNAQAAVTSALNLLPLSLLDFSASLAGASVRLDWEVASGGSLNHFEAEHAGESLQWHTVGRLPFLPALTQYNLVHDKPRPEMNYYRLKMIDIDGSVSYSKVTSLDLSAQQDGLAVFPNPSSGLVSLLGAWNAGTVPVRITDANGRLLLQLELHPSSDNELLTLDLTALPSGIFFITAHGIYRERIVKY